MAYVPWLRVVRQVMTSLCPDNTARPRALPMPFSTAVPSEDIVQIELPLGATLDHVDPNLQPAFAAFFLCGGRPWSSVSDPETDFPCLPIVPPVDPACANAFCPVSGNADIAHSMITPVEMAAQLIEIPPGTIMQI